MEKNADERIARRYLEKAELKKDLDEDRDLCKRMEKNADERIKATRQALETELADLRNSLARRDLEKAMKAARRDLETELADLPSPFARLELEQVDEEMQLPMEPTSCLSQSFALRPGVSPSEPIDIVQKSIVQVESPSISNGTYFIKNRTGDIYWAKDAGGT